MKKFLLISLILLLLTSCNNSKKEAQYLSADYYPEWFTDEALLDKHIDSLIAEMSIEEKAGQMVHEAQAIPDLEIPAYNYWNEALHGIARSSRATVFPQAIGLAATFNPDLIGDIASAISTEGRAIYNEALKTGHVQKYQGLTYWSPNVNIFRDPRWGRGQETYGEDPYLSGVLGESFVKGLQGDHPYIMKAAACAKHYAVHSGPEALRHEFDAETGPQDLYATYLPAFKKLVDAGVEGVMCAYNSVNGIPCCGHDYLLMDVLRQQWGFDGYLVSDCWALVDIHENHKYKDTPAESAALAIKNEVNLNCGYVYDFLPEAVGQGLILEAEVDHVLKPLLRTRFKLGILGDLPDPYAGLDASSIGSEEHRELAKEAALQSIVLLKNHNDILPLSKRLPTVFVTGPFAADINVLLGNYNGISGDLVTILEGVTSMVSPATRVHFSQGILIGCEQEGDDYSRAYGADGADATIVAMGVSPLMEGEEGESIASEENGDRASLTIPRNQIEYLRALRRISGNKPLIAVLTGGSPVIDPEIYELSDAVLFAWYPGEKGGMAIADVIFGNESPAGRLPITFPESLDDLPPYSNYSMKGRTYRYLDKAPLFPFGFGLSYTRFSYDNLLIEKKEISEGETLQVSVDISNIGDVQGDEVVQLYVQHSNRDQGFPNWRMIDVKRMSVAPGESGNVEFNIDAEALKEVDVDGNLTWITGEMKVVAAACAPVGFKRKPETLPMISGEVVLR